MSLADVTFNRALSVVLGSVEAGVAIVASCLPILPPVFKKLVYGSIEGPASKRGPRGAPPSGPVVWIETIGGGKIAVTGSKVPVNYNSPVKVRPNGKTSGESEHDSLELEHISHV